jgi:hypothetical protein
MTDSVDLTTAGQVIDALGNRTVMSLTGNEGKPTVISNWRVSNRFPAKTYVVMTTALAQIGKRAPAALWGMVEPERAPS